MPAPEPALPGLASGDEEEDAGTFFARIPWDEPLPDPAMAAGDFLDAVGGHDR